ncbi:MAG: UDP-N-acetylmuramate dehydrogenase [Patescibacteria group bacterium]|jgi:UDP-N-acetylmuramate dehydrogenase
MEKIIKIQKNIPLAPFTTFKIGGPAKFFIEVKAKAELVSAIAWAKEKKEKIFIVGGGSNMLVNDQGVDGLVIRLANESMSINKNTIIAGAGVSLAKILKAAAEKGLSGMEWTAGIPKATIGGAVRGNAEAFSSPIGKIVKIVEIFDIRKNKFAALKQKDCQFKYRDSIFKKKDNYIIWEAKLALKKSNPEKVKKQMIENLKFRQAMPKLPSAGSVFKNIPLKDIKRARPELAAKLKALGNARLGNIGAGLVIDKILDLKGKKIGGAMISLEHGNFIINTGKATAEDIVNLICVIKQKARNKLNLKLEEEIKYLGFE